MVPATAASQLDFQRALIRQPGIDWSGVEVFQLDEYIGLRGQPSRQFSHHAPREPDRSHEPRPLPSHRNQRGLRPRSRTCALESRNRGTSHGSGRVGHRRERASRVQRSAGGLRRRPTRTSSCRSTTRAGSNRSARAGSPGSRTSRRPRSRCPFGRCSARASSSRSFPTNERPLP